MDSGHAKLYRAHQEEKAIGSLHVSDFYGNAKSAIVLPAVRASYPSGSRNFEELFEAGPE